MNKEILVTEDELEKIIEKTAQKVTEDQSEGYKKFCELYPALCTKEDAKTIFSEEIAKIKIPEPEKIDLAPLQKEIKNLRESLPSKTEEHGLGHPVSAFMNFCPQCGIKVKEKPTEHQCVDCGMPVDIKDNACWNCGGTKAKQTEAKIRKLKIE